MKSITLRKSFVNDIPGIEELYQRAAVHEGGLARTASEITRDYVEHFVSKSIYSGIEIIAAGDEPGRIVGEIHCYANGIAALSHVLTDLTIAVDPEYQGKGVGRMLFTELLNDVTVNRPDILRVELIARESNLRAISFYESLGFKKEGRLTKRIKRSNGDFEDDLVMGWLR
ncbi:MAG: N-acetyltransferase [Bacteriovoracaceae bacterium]|nr:GNAT family N-acetyltransferase [Bacteroidota bacterium]